MRISLLQTREPFEAILVRTLERFLPSLTGMKHSVCWNTRGAASPAGRDEQTWLCNVYLNAIFAAGAGAETLAPVVREFSRSRVWWRRPAQQAYVALAAARATAPLLSQSSLRITPRVPRAEALLIVGGNHKLRLLDRESRRSYAVLKDGFDRRFIERELETRRLAAELGLPTPRLEAFADDGSWFAEEFVAGTPLNRLGDEKKADSALRQAQAALGRLYRATARQTTTGEYLDELSPSIERRLNDNPRLSARRQELETMRRELLLTLAPFRREALTTVITHGDFQPANILSEGDRVWLIDWEYSARRQLLYDALVCGLRSRSGEGLAERLRQFADGHPRETAWVEEHGPEMRREESEQRRRHAALFLLEELSLQLDENANPSFTQIGHGLTTLQSEIGRWLASSEETR